MIKLVDDKDFSELLELYFRMFKSIDDSVRKSQVFMHLASSMNNAGFMAHGYYHEGKMVGFTSGYIDGQVFRFTGIYSERKTAVISLINHSENAVRELGLTKWVTVVNGNGHSIVPKIGAEIDYIQYKKDL